jgi:hypothetical protein
MTSQTPTNVTSTGLQNSCYIFLVERNGRHTEAELTYNLNEENPIRHLLRLQETDALKLFRDLPSDREFQKFRSQVNDQRERGIGNISIAKGMVLEQYDSSEKNPYLGSAVHRMGAVPVFLVPPALTGPVNDIELHGKLIKPVICVYPNIGGQGSLIKADLLRSFSIQLDRMFIKYLEDVGEHMHDIENYLSRIDVCERAKQAETVLKQSIALKVETILNYVETTTDPQLHKLATDIWSQYSSAIATAALARVFALFMINELYRHLGIKDKSSKYEQDWNHLSEVFANLLSEEDFDELFKAGSELSYLRQARAHYLAESPDSDFDALYAQSEVYKVRWVQEFVAFARFVAGLSRESPSIGTGRLFFSFQQNIAAAADMYKSITEYVGKQSPINGQHGVQVFTVDSQSPGADIERLIRTRIWLSDVLMAVIPREWQESVTNQKKNLHWVVKEVDYGLLLERLFRLFLEEGVSEDELSQAFAEDIELIAPTHGRYDHEKRKERRLRQLQNLHAKFVYTADTQLSPDLQQKFDLIIKETRERHARHVIVGFFHQFEDPEMVAWILSLTPFPETKKWICGQIADERRKALTARRIYPKMAPAIKRQMLRKIEKDVRKYQTSIADRFNLARTAVANRGLTINSHDWYLLAESGRGTKRTFQSNLRQILKSLMPEAPEDEITEMHERVFSLVGVTPIQRVA